MLLNRYNKFSLVRFSKWLFPLLGCLFFISIGNVNAAALEVVISNEKNVSPVDVKYYYEQLLRLALERTRNTDGDFVIVHNPNDGGIDRSRAMLVAGMGINVMWGSVTAARAQAVHVIPVNLLKNLNNYRVLIIRKDDQASFNNIKTLDDLRKLPAGSGLHWTDTSILNDSGIEVVTSANYSGLFKMLAARRFHYISRGLHEYDFDLSQYAYLGLALETKLMLHYDKPTAYSFFVNKANLKLADRIERGLVLAQADGSFDALFDSMPSFKKGMEILNSANRIVIELKNNTGS